jgi:hypothetical protein
MSSNLLLDFSWWGLALQLVGAVIITGIHRRGPGVSGPWGLTGEIVGGGRRDRWPRRDDRSHSVAYHWASNLAPGSHVYAHTLPAHPAEEAVRVGEGAALCCCTTPRRSTVKLPNKESASIALRFPWATGGQVGSKSRTAAKAETMGCARADRRAFDSQPRDRSGLAVWRPVERRYALATEYRQSSARRPFRLNIYHKHGNGQTERPGA